MDRAYGAPRESIQISAGRIGLPSPATGTVPDHCAVQQTATIDSGGTTPLPSSRDEALPISSHQRSGSCSAPPPGSSSTSQTSCSAAITAPATDTSATLSAEVPTSIA